MQNKSRISDRASIATKALEDAWTMLIKINHNIPHVIVTILTAGDRKRKHGHLSPTVWQYRDNKRRHEVGLSSNLFEDKGNLLCTMLHEATHAILHKENWGCSRSANPKYHIVSFRDTCEKLGLKCVFRDTRDGWALTSWPDDKIPDIYEPVLKHLKKEIPKGTGWGRIVKGPGQDLPKPGHIRLSCKCDGKRRSIYVNKSVLEEGGIICDLCGAKFMPLTNASPQVELYKKEGQQGLITLPAPINDLKLLYKAHDNKTDSYLS